jgi:hypothetical protein
MSERCVQAVTSRSGIWRPAADRSSARHERCGGGAGSVGWPGAHGGWWQADPNDGTVLIFLAHSMFRLDQLAKGIGLGVWDAMRQFPALGSESPRSYRSTVS